MLKQLRIQNFKNWKDTGSIRLSPISLFFGTNSSGKSSIGQFLMMLKQTVESSDRKTVFFPGGKNSAVQLGSYREMVFERDLNKKIIFDYQWTLQESLEFKDPLAKERYSGDALAFHAKIGLEGQEQNNLLVEDMKYDLSKEGKSEFCIGMVKKSISSPDYSVQPQPANYKLVKQRGRPWPLTEVVRFYGFPGEAVGYYQNAGFMQEFNLRHEQLFKSICYLGPLRTKVERLYSWGGVNPESVGFSGERTIDAILAASNRRINFGHWQRLQPFKEIIAQKLKEMGLIEEFKVERISEQRREYEVQVRTKGLKQWVDLPDVGFGISQVLPVLVQCFYAPSDSIILIEQPEIHLHPNAQAALADVMIDVIRSRENNRDRNIQLIIETHSEHFLRRLQRRIAEDRLSQEEVSVYFANITQAPAFLELLKLDEYGNIQNWPENFFGDEMGDIIAQSKATMEKRNKPK